MILTDGLRPDAIEPGRMPALDRLVGEHTSARAATTVRPSTTIAALSTLTTGLAPASHRLLEPGPGFVRRLRKLTLLPRGLGRHGLPSRILSSHLPALERALLPALTAAAGFRSWRCVARRARDVAAATLKVLERRESGVFFVYLNDVDQAGHRHGWMSAPYLEASAELDVAVGLLSRLVEDSLVIVLADHGGGGVTATHHREPHPLNDRIPLVLAGPRVARCVQLGEPVSILDVPPTMYHWLGVPVPSAFEGRALTEVVAPPRELSVVKS